MSERHLGRRIPMCERASSSSVQKPSFPTRRTSKQHRKRKTIERCKSEPCLWRVNGVGDNEDDRRDVTTSLEVLLRPQTCSNIFFSPDYLNNVSSTQGSRVIFLFEIEALMLLLYMKPFFLKYLKGLFSCSLFTQHYEFFCVNQILENDIKMVVTADLYRNGNDSCHLYTEKNFF